MIDEVSIRYAMISLFSTERQYICENCALDDPEIMAEYPYRAALKEISKEQFKKCKEAGHYCWVSAKVSDDVWLNVGQELWE